MGMMRSIELFVGAGGLGIAASRAGFEPAMVIDWDKWACDTIRENKQRGLAPFARCNVVECDSRGDDFAQVKEPIDLVTGRPPCPPLSLGGRASRLRVAAQLVKDGRRSGIDPGDQFPEDGGQAW